jgi:hypothetical protein
MQDGMQEMVVLMLPAALTEAQEPGDSVIL